MLKSLTRQSAGIETTSPERIVQFGGGNFLRAFVDWIVQVLNEETDFDSGVVIIKLTPRGSYADLKAQEGLFHVQLRGYEGDELINHRKLISCVNRSINPYQAYDAYLELARQPEIRFIVSNTTEAGISFDADARLDDAPSTGFPAKLTTFLYERYKHFSGDAEKGCILLPCELIEQNGDQLKKIILQYAALWKLDAGFAEWIDAHNLFCNTLVDRIVSGYPENDAESTLQEIGYDDKLLVAGEWFHSWVIEGPESLYDEFPVNQTALNVKIVPDARPYREMKVRVLNGAHTSMVPVGYLMGIETVREAVENPALGPFLKALIHEEIIPAMPEPHDEARQFAGAVMDRFRNPYIHHLLLSIALNSTSKFKARLLPTLNDFVTRKNALPKRIVFALAALIRFYKGTWQGEDVPLNDDAETIAWFKQQWDSAGSMQALVAAILANDSLWGQDLNSIPGLPARLAGYLESIESESIMAVLKNTDW